MQNPWINHEKWVKFCVQATRNNREDYLKEDADII